MVFHPSVSWFSYEWNTITLWNAVKDEQQIPAAEKLNQSERCLVWRHELRTLFRTLEHHEARVFPQMLAGSTFGELCELLAEYVEDTEQVPMQAASLLRTWINNGLISELRF